MKLAPLFVLFALLFAGLHTLTDNKPTFEQAVTTYYKNVALANMHQLQWSQITQADSKAVDASIETMKQRCQGTFSGLDQFEPKCTPKPEPTPTKQP